LVVVGMQRVHMQRRNIPLALRVLLALSAIFAVAGVALFFLHAFSYVIALALAAVFALGTLAAKVLESSRAVRP
jgi:uncharacterized membrane protein